MLASRYVSPTASALHALGGSEAQNLGEGRQGQVQDRPFGGCHNGTPAPC